MNLKYLSTSERREISKKKKEDIKQENAHRKESIKNDRKKYILNYNTDKNTDSFVDDEIQSSDELTYGEDEYHTTNYDFIMPKTTTTSHDDQLRSHHGVSILRSVVRIPPIFTSWESSSLNINILKAIREIAKYDKPSPVQMQAIPILQSAHDLVAIAKTGCGKTAAFTLPIIDALLNQKSTRDGPFAVILAPSRELAIQIEHEIEKFVSFATVRVVSIVGGRSIDEQSHILALGVDIIVGTPGRMVDAIDRKYAVIHDIKYLILDEADKMMDSGFEGFVTAIFNNIFEQPNEIREGLTVGLFSATMPGKVEAITKKYLTNPIRLSINQNEHEILSAVRHHFVPVRSESDKFAKLSGAVKKFGYPVIVFVNRKSVADQICSSLESHGIKSSCLHSGKTQVLRENAINMFKLGKRDVLVATDVAARGIDVQGIKHVINFDIPSTIEDYIHRVGRTARGECTDGDSSMFVDYKIVDLDFLTDLEQYLKSNNISIPKEFFSTKKDRMGHTFVPM